MKRARQPLNALLRDLYEAQPSVREAFVRAEAAGVPLHVLLDHLTFDDLPSLHEHDGMLLVTLDVWPEDWLHELIEHLGGVPQAQAVLDRTRGWRRLDLAQKLRLDGLRGGILGGLAQGAPLAELLPLLHEGGEALAHLYPTVLRAFPVSALVTEADVPEAPLRAELARRGLTPELALELFRELGDAAALNVLASRYARHGQGTTVEERAIDVLAGLHAEHGRSLWGLRAFAEERVSQACWLGIFHRRGFSPAFCALAALEAGGSAVAAASLLGRAGLAEEEVYDGLISAGAGPEPLLCTLRNAGWQPARMVTSLRASGALDPEVREALLKLGLHPEDVGALLSTSFGHAR